MIPNNFIGPLTASERTEQAKTYPRPTVDNNPVAQASQNVTSLQNGTAKDSQGNPITGFSNNQSTPQPTPPVSPAQTYPRPAPTPPPTIPGLNPAESSSYDSSVKSLGTPNTVETQLKNESDLIAGRRKQSQDSIDKIMAFENDKIRNAEKGAEYNAAASGMMGTPSGRNAVKDARDQAVNESQATIAKILLGIDSQAQSDANLLSQQEQARASNDISTLNSIADKRQAAQVTSRANFTDLAKTSNLQWDDLMAQHPDFAQKLLQQTGYEDYEAKFKFNAAKSAAQQVQWNDTPQKTATGFLFTGVDPTTGKIVTNEVTASVGSQWQISPGNMYQDTLIYNKDTGEYKTLKSYNDAIPNNISSLAPDGTNGGQCGDFVHTIVDNVPSMGDTVQSKKDMIDKQGVLAANWNPKIGDVIVQTLGAAGHAAVVVGVNNDGTIQVKQSNKNLDEKVTTETLKKDDPSIYGAYTKGAMKSSAADGSMSPRELALRKQIASLNRTDKLNQATDVMIASRRGTIVNNTIRSLYGSTQNNPIAIYNKSAQVINRVDAALQHALDPNNSAKNVADLDLIDAYVQIARGGQAITEAQVDTLLKGMGISAKFDVATQKISGGATLDDTTRKELASLAKNIYSEQGQSANQALSQINNQLKVNGIPDNMLLQKPMDITGNESPLSQLDQQTLTSLQSQLAADEVLAQDADGNIVAATQEDINSGQYTALNP